MKDSERNNQKNHFIFPSPGLRCLIVGRSNCGKTFLLLKILLGKFVDFNHLFLCSKSIHQPEYKLLKKYFDKGYNQSETIELFEMGNGDIDDFLENLPIKRNSKSKIEYFQETTPIPDPRGVDSKKKNLFIFDDIATERDQSPADYTRGRHNN